MSKSIKNLLIFISGAAMGSIVTNHMLKTKYEQIAQEEIDSVKEVFYKNNILPKEEARKKADEAKDKVDILEYSAHLREGGYVNYSTNTEEKTEEEVDDSMSPYVISPEDFGELGYSEVNLTYYSDGVLADMDDEMVEDVEETVGFNSLNQFGKFEDDAVHVRDDRLKIDYEILKDNRTYKEAMKYRPGKPREE